MGDQAKAQQLLAKFQGQSLAVEKFVNAYRQYCWKVESLDDMKLAPFHLLATEGKVHTDQNHLWHMETLANDLRTRSDHPPGDRVQGRRSHRFGQ